MEIGKHDRNSVLWNFNWIKKKKEDKRKQLGNGNIDSSWAAKSS